MDARNGLVNFFLFVVLFAFSFVFSVDALVASNVLYGAFALFGFLVCIATSLFNSVIASREGDALAVWYRTYSVVVSIIFVWYVTRCGVLFQWW